LQISLNKIESDAEFEEIKNLYLTAFPPSERREFDELKKQIYNENCNVNLILAGEKVVGFVVLWNFTEFVFLEHFATEPGLRGLGIGEKTLSEIKSQFQKTVILETELPNDELSQRRIRFYERNGFHKLCRTYFQPAYGANKPEVELKLMSTNVDLAENQIDNYISVIREKVYQIIFATKSPKH
jgi:ribosomal protein S18 acetylase RimI-like enzyme